MNYEHPLGYLLGIEGIALLHAFTGEYDRAFTEARIAEIRRLLDDESLAGAGVDVDRLNTVEGYRVWSETYDQPGNAMFDLEEPVVREIVGALPTGTAVDAACGTGRYAEYLAAQGHQVIGVDSSPDMLAHARTRVPGADFRTGELDALPLADGSADLVVCALALTHVPDLGPILAEYARVLRPGGHLVISDAHQESVFRGSIPAVRGPGGRPGRLPGYRHLAGDYLRAALPLGFQVRRCEEPRLPDGDTPPAASTETGPWHLWPWSLAAMVPEAAKAANAGRPATIIWQFELSEPVTARA